MTIRLSARTFVFYWRMRRADLVKAVRDAARGGHYPSAPFSKQKLIDIFRKPVVLIWIKLTFRERQVLQLVAERFTNHQTASRLRISRRRVEVHRVNLMSKLRLHSPVGLMRFALNQELVLLESSLPEHAPNEAR